MVVCLGSVWVYVVGAVVAGVPCDWSVMVGVVVVLVIVAVV